MKHLSWGASQVSKKFFVYPVAFFGGMVIENNPAGTFSSRDFNPGFLMFSQFFPGFDDNGIGWSGLVIHLLCQQVPYLVFGLAHGKIRFDDLTSQLILDFFIRQRQQGPGVAH